MPEVSIVMTARRRALQLEQTLPSIYSQGFKDFEVICVEDGDDGGATKAICERYGVRYFRREHRPDRPYSNPAVPNNIGLRQAKGEIILIQNAEISHVSEELINRLCGPVREDAMVSTFTSVMALNADGTDKSWYVHSKHNPRPFFFCQALKKSVVERLRGFDEDYLYYGYDDDDFALRLKFAGIELRFMDDLLAHHLWHESSGFCYGLDDNRRTFEKKLAQMMRREIGVERNLGREWGSLDS